MKQNTFRAYFGTESEGAGSDSVEDSKSSGESFTDLPMVLEAEDQEIVRGRFGFIVNENKGVFIDNYNFKGLVCQKEKNPTSLRFLAPECNRFKENYVGQFDDRLAQ